MYCHGHFLLAEKQKDLPKGSDGQPVPGFLTYLRPKSDDQDDDGDD